MKILYTILLGKIINSEVKYEASDWKCTSKTTVVKQVSLSSFINTCITRAPKYSVIGLSQVEHQHFAQTIADHH